MTNTLMVYDCKALGKPRMTRRDAWAKRPCVLRFWDYKDHIVAEAKKQNFVLADSFLVKVHFKLPDSYSKKKKTALLGHPHQVKPDIDNILKGLMDILKEKDQTVYKVTAEKTWAHENYIEIYNLD